MWKGSPFPQRAPHCDYLSICLMNQRRVDTGKTSPQLTPDADRINVKLLTLFIIVEEAKRL